ncbi:unnamed protein product [Spodoptera exigua]|nr:unnamed protein product [Spodoptera exigua]
MNKSHSESDVNQEDLNTTPTFVFQRIKRSREDMEGSIGKEFAEFKEEVRKMLNGFAEKQKQEIQQIVNSSLKEIQQSNEKLVSSIEFLTGKYEELKNKHEVLENQAREDRSHIKILEEKIESIQTSNQKTNFVIKNVPRKQGEAKEDLIEMVMCLSKHLDCPIAKHDIKDVYRVRGKNSEKLNTPIIVETGSTLLKTDIIKMGKAFAIKTNSKLSGKHLGLKSDSYADIPVFLSDHLTPKSSRLHFLARDLTKSGMFKFCWTSYGKVLLKKDEQSATILVTSEHQIHQLRLGK